MASSYQVVTEENDASVATSGLGATMLSFGKEQMSGIQPDTPKSSWQDIRRSVRASRKMHVQFVNKIPQNFTFIPLENMCTTHPSETVSSNDTPSKDLKTRVLFLGVPPGQRESSLLYVDVPFKQTPEHLDKPVEWKSVLGIFQSNLHTDKYSKEEELLRERKRLSVHGITSYQISDDNSRILFPASGSLFFMKLADLGMVHMKYSIRSGMFITSNLPEPCEIFTNCPNARMDPKMSPTEPDLIAFIHDNDLWVTHMKSQTEKRLTYVHKGFQNCDENTISAGVACYIIQEEFDRYTGYWWQPHNTKGLHRILYEVVDESNVEILHISNPTGGTGLDSYHYPKAGTPNAVVSLRLLEFSTTDDGQVLDPVIKKLSEPLNEMFPSMEYIIRVGWLPSGKGIWTQLLDRKQQKTMIVHIPVSKFDRLENDDELRMMNPLSQMDDILPGQNESDVEMKDCTSSLLMGSPHNVVKILYEESSDVWINVHDCFYFFNNDSTDEVSFIWASEQTGHRHLYHIHCSLKKINRSKRHSTGDLVSSECRTCWSTVTAITQGNWEVLEHSDSIWVDEKNQNVYFMALKDTPLESHLYVSSFVHPKNPTRLTNLGSSHSISMSKDCRLFITVSSNIKELYSAKIYTISPRPIAVVNLLETQALLPEYVPPEIFSFTNSNGDLLYGLYHKPRNIQPDKKYPTVLYIYGGPHVQLVTNSFKGLRYQRLYTLSSLGYAVVVIDGRGSPHRGINFESHLKYRMGQVEIVDQVEGLQSLAKRVDFIDLSRIAIHGWSYGGYLSLMGLAQRPDLFKVAVSGAPVVTWEQYDTGYTERYMGTPKSNPEGYREGSVINSLNKFPDEPNRLLIVHGLIDENVHFHHTSSLIDALVKQCKPYQLQIYPGERHGIRKPESNEHFEVQVISFLQQHL